jgi:hypothetical protein
LSVVLYGCETWSPTLREEHRLRVFENRVRRRVFGPRKDKVTGEWRKLHNGEHYNLYLSPDIIRQIKENEVGRAYDMHRRGQKSVQGFGGKAKGKGSLGRLRCKWQDGIRMDLREIGCVCMCVQWIHLAYDRDRWQAFVNAVMNLRVLAPQS